MGTFVRQFTQGDLFRFTCEQDRLEKLLDGKDLGYAVRPYQKLAVQGVFKALEVHRSTLLVMATGSGKAVVAGYIAAMWKQVCHTHNLSPRVLFLAHRQELVKQAARKMRAVCPLDQVEIEMAEKKVSDNSRARIVVGSVETMTGKRLAKFDPEDFGLIIQDEAHHSIESNSSWRGILNRFPRSKSVGLTATPLRSDRIRLADTFESVAFVYSLETAIADGFLVPVRVQALTVTEYDDSGVSFGEMDVAKGSVTLQQELKLQGLVSAVTRIADTQNKWAGRRPTILILPSVATSRRCAAIFNRHAERHGTGRAEFVDCDLKFCSKMEREQRQADFERGKVQYLCNYSVYSEGTDLPTVRMVVIARRVRSQLAYMQAVGRGTRPWPTVVDALNAAADAAARRQIIYDSPKPAALVVEPACWAGLNNLVTSADVLGGDESEWVIKEVRKAVARNAEEGKPTDIEREIATARTRQQEEEEEAKRKGIVVRAEYQVKEVDPFGVLKEMREEPKLPGMMKEALATAGQKAFLTGRLGVAQRQAGKMTFKEAKALIEENSRRMAVGLCTYRQSRLLAKMGLPGDLTRQEFSLIFEDLKAKHFRKLYPSEVQKILAKLPGRR